MAGNSFFLLKSIFQITQLTIKYLYFQNKFHLKAVMPINFRPLGVDNEKSGYIGVVICIASAIVGISVSLIADRLRKYMKLTLLTLLILETISFTWMTLLCEKVIPFR